MRPMTSTAAATAKVLADAGIERVFGLPGGEVLVLMDELRRAGLDFVLMRHEANAGIAAAVYGKLRRQPGVVLTTLGPGAANLMLPMSNAFLDREPLLAISAQIPDDFPASHTHQLLPLHETYRPIARYVEKITGSNVLDVVPQALARCMEHPFDIQNVSGSRLGQYCPKRYLCEPTSVVTIVSAGITDARASMMSPGHIVPAGGVRSVSIRLRLS